MSLYVNVMFAVGLHLHNKLHYVNVKQNVADLPQIKNGFYMYWQKVGCFGSNIYRSHLLLISVMIPFHG